MDFQEARPITSSGYLALGAVNYASKYMKINWDPCTHWDTGHYVGIHDSAVGHDKEAMSSHFHMDHSYFMSLLSWTLYSHICIIIPSLDHKWEPFDAFEEVFIGSWSGYKWLC
jgi:hypothetical protein